MLRGRAIEPTGTAVTAFARALSATDPAAAEAAFRESLEATPEGELDCVILWKWAELARERALDSLSEVCARLARPRVPTPLCVAARCR